MPGCQRPLGRESLLRLHNAAGAAFNCAALRAHGTARSMPCKATAPLCYTSATFSVRDVVVPLVAFPRARFSVAVDDFRAARQVFLMYGVIARGMQSAAFAPSSFLRFKRTHVAGSIGLQMPLLQ